MTRATIVSSLFLAIILILPPPDCLAQAKDTKDIASIQNRLEKIENNLTEIRRDQLNYKVEKDLLKEAFSSNYQTINIVLTIVLGLFTLVGFLGIRDIGAIKKEYSAELERMNALRKDLEINVTKIREEQEKVKSDHLEITRTNEDQNRRIKILELQEKISSLVIARNYERAYEYAIAGLTLDPHNTTLLLQKAGILAKLNDLDSATNTLTDLLKENPRDNYAILNLLELFLLKKRIQDYDELYTNNKSLVDQSDDFHLTMYFHLLKNYQLGLEKELENQTKEYLQTFPDDINPPITWEFDLAQKMLEPQPATRAKKLLTTFIRFLSGNMPKDEALKHIA